MATTDLIRYDLLVQDAMREVMRKVLASVAASGYLPGDHHFTISFHTRAPGVKISRRLAEQWPREMTIILQHQFSDLLVDEFGFGVGLSFRSIFEQLYIPFEAVTGFYDTSVGFAVKFEILEDAAGEEAPARPGPTLVRAEAEPAPSAKPAPAKAEQVEPEPSPPGEPAKIVSIDTFRKKR